MSDGLCRECGYGVGEGHAVRCSFGPSPDASPTGGGSASQDEAVAWLHKDGKTVPLYTAPRSVAQGDADREEAAFWEFDARRKGYGEWAGRPQSERDAFKWTLRNYDRRTESLDARTIEACARVCGMSADQVSLMAGEMTTGEMRLVLAVLRGVAAAIRALSPPQIDGEAK